jgi:hypothetical protein
MLVEYNIAPYFDHQCMEFVVLFTTHTAIGVSQAESQAGRGDGATKPARAVQVVFPTRFTALH